MKTLVPFLILLIFANIAQAQNTKNLVKKYFKTYEIRDFEVLKEFYHKDAIFEDIIFGEYREGVEDIFKFLNQGVELHLVNTKDKKIWHIQNIIVQGDKAVVEGWHARFYMSDDKGKIYGPWRFSTFLYFKSGKIIKHIDFFNYPDDLLKHRKYQNKTE